MSIRKVFAVASLIALGATPFTTQASGEDVAVNACINSFVEANLKDRIVRVRKQLPAPSPLTPHIAPTVTVALTARGAESGQLIAQARCIASTRGTVIVIDSPDPSTYIAMADYAVTLN